MLPNRTWALSGVHQEPFLLRTKSSHNFPTRMSEVRWKSEPNTGENLRNLAVNVPTEPYCSGIGTPEQGCLVRAGHFGSAL